MYWLVGMEVVQYMSSYLMSTAVNYLDTSRKYLDKRAARS